MVRNPGIGGIFGAILTWIWRLLLLFALALAGLIFLYRFYPPVSTLMLYRMLTHQPINQRFVPLENISTNLLAAVIVSEDARFCRHNGVDWGALEEVLDQSGTRGPARGASTIPMQTVKNLFLWPSRSYLRKGAEIPLALALDLVWPKRRILEVYLNIAEWGDGIFGAEAAARAYFSKPARDLDAQEAALLVSILPNPRHRDPRHPSRRVTFHAGIVLARARDAVALFDCLK